MFKNEKIKSRKKLQFYEEILFLIMLRDLKNIDYIYITRILDKEKNNYIRKKQNKEEEYKIEDKLESI